MSKHVSFAFEDKNQTEDATASFLQQNIEEEPTPPEMRGKSAELLSISHKPNYRHLLAALFFVGFMNYQAGYIGG